MTDGQTASRAARALIRQYGTRDPYELADWLHILVDFSPHPRLLGFSVVIFNKQVIGLNSRADPNTRRCACAHELAHLALGHHENERFHSNHLTRFSLCGQRFENEANIFAAALLMDDRDVDEAIQNYPDVRSAAASLYVCAELFMSKLQLLNAEGHNYRVPAPPLRAWDGYIR